MQIGIGKFAFLINEQLDFDDLDPQNMSVQEIPIFLQISDPSYFTNALPWHQKYSFPQLRSEITSKEVLLLYGRSRDTMILQQFNVQLPSYHLTFLPSPIKKVAFQNIPFYKFLKADIFA